MKKDDKKITIRNSTEHLKNIFETEELAENSVIRNYGIKSRLGFVFGVKMRRRASRFTAGTIMIK